MIYKTTMIASIIANAMASKRGIDINVNIDWRSQDDEKLSAASPAGAPADSIEGIFGEGRGIHVNDLIKSGRLQLLQKHVDDCRLQPCECPLHFLGGGISGQVYKVIFDGEERALKVCPGVGPNNQEIEAYKMVRDLNIEGVNATIDMWSEQRAPENLLELFEFPKTGGLTRIMEGACQFLVLELCEGNLGEKVEEMKKNIMEHTEDVANATCTFFQWARDLAAAYKSIHENNIIHIDGKLANVIMARRGDQFVPKLTDLDAMYKIEEGNYVTVEGRACGISWGPEISDTKKASKASDIYALGHTLQTMFYCLGAGVLSSDRTSTLMTCIVACKNRYAAARPDINDVWNLLKYEHLLAAGQEVDEFGKSAEEESRRLEAQMAELSRQSPPRAPASVDQVETKCRCTIFR